MVPSVLAAAVPMMVVEAVFGPDVNTGGWERATYVFPFLQVPDRLRPAVRGRAAPLPPAALVVACAATGALLAWAGALSGSAAGLTGVPAGWSALQGLAGWAWTAAIMGFAGSVAARRGGRPPNTPAPPLAAPRPRWLRAARYANEAVLPFYLLHEPVIVAAPRGSSSAARAGPRQVRGAGYRVLRRDPRPVRGAGPAVPRHPAPIRHEAPHQARDPAPGSASDRRGHGSVASGWRSTPAASSRGPRR